VTASGRRFEIREYRPSLQLELSMTRRRWIELAFIVIAAIAGLSFWHLRSDPMRRLVRSMPQETRLIESRLTGGFRWAPFKRRIMRSSADGESIQRPARMASAEWWVLSRTTSGSPASARHAAALAMLLQGVRRQAIAGLAQLTTETNAEPRTWSDLAAARYEVAVAENDAALLAESLVAVDAALRLDPLIAEARFNRALILERLGLRDQAREAWERFLETENKTRWADEARERIRSLSPIPSFRKLLQKEYDHLASDADFAHSIAREHPQECRQYGEAVILGSWAASWAAGDREAAERHLRIARSFGEELARHRGEGMLKAAVRAVDVADDEGRKHLAAAQALFRQAQNEFGADRAKAAQPLFVRAAQEFDAGGSPIALSARFYLAHTYHALGNLLEARRRELRLLDEAPPEFRAHRAHLLWHIGLGYQADGTWGKAMPAFQESSAIFEALGESDFATTMHEMIAEIYDRTGDPRSAWAERIIAFRGIGRMTSARLQLSLDSVARGAMLRKEWPVAASFLDLAGATAQRIDRPVTEVDTHLLQAHVFRRMEDAGSAARALDQASAAAARIEDAAARENAGADIMATEAILTPSPDVAVALLSRAIDYHRTRGRRMLLPDMLLRRGRAFRDLRQYDLAAADMEAGITEVEIHRQSLPGGESRWGIFHAAEDLFEEAIGLALARNDVGKAFAYAERARARELLEALGAGAPLVGPSAFPSGVTVVEYVAMPDRLVVFVVARGEIRLAVQQIGRAALERETENFSRAAAGESAEMRPLSRALYGRLIKPIENDLPGSETIVFVPGKSLAAVPFAALSNERGEYLIERFEIVVDPSASVFAHLADRKRSAGGNNHHVLVVANPAEPSKAPLVGAEQEAEEVASMYARATRLTRERATVAEFRRQAPEADVIHLATHGTGTSPNRPSAALLFAGGVLDARTIAGIDLSRTNAVVLAACETARGPEPAEGTISVARSFLVAGVPAVAATLWSIEDTTSAEFFPRVHRHLARGLSLRRALREAQIESIRQRDTPAIWAAVQCIGN
jgi:CHAT domain-containing protein